MAWPHNEWSSYVSNAQGIAFLSFGLIIVGGGGSFPIPYDVRVGVDNGNGELGTLTSPSLSNVRQGILYGGDGDQYTGTLYIAPSPTGEIWKDVRQAGEEFRQVLWGTMVSTSTYLAGVPCEATSPEDRQQLNRNNVMPEKPVSIAVLNADYVLLGSPRPRAEITWEGYTFLIYATNSDPADATVDMRCLLKT